MAIEFLPGEGQTLLSDLYMFGGLILIAALAHLVGLRAERNRRRYWIWFLLALGFGPFGLVLVFLLLEASIREEREDARPPGGTHRQTRST
jgi:hypothetical protein